MAVTLTETELIAAMCSDIDAASAARLLAVATYLVERYAPDAPDVIHNEAVVRTVGWLWDSPPANLASDRVGETAQEFAVGQLSPLRHSGAQSLLNPWKVRRAGTI